MYDKELLFDWNLFAKKKKYHCFHFKKLHHKTFKRDFWNYLIFHDLWDLSFILFTILKSSSTIGILFIKQYWTWLIKHEINLFRYFLKDILFLNFASLYIIATGAFNEPVDKGTSLHHFFYWDYPKTDSINQCPRWNERIFIINSNIAMKNKTRRRSHAKHLPINRIPSGLRFTCTS